ncbi:MAG: phosphoribosylformylglycinamidine synthase subunit PurL [bacterium]
MFWRVAVTKRGRDPVAQALRSDLAGSGLRNLTEVVFSRLYFVRGLSAAGDEPGERKAVERIARELLSDPVSEGFGVSMGEVARLDIEVLHNPGVMDPSEASTLRALADMGFPGAELRTGRGYAFNRRLSLGEKRVICALIMNPLIEHVARPGEAVFAVPRPYRFRRRTVRLSGRSPRELEGISRRGLLALNREEMLALQRHFGELGREPTDVELETFAQTWSEHCQHKTFRGEIDHDGRVIKNLLKSTIFRLTRELNPDWCLSVFHDNSGAIAFDDEYALTFKVETHNHPSALEPYGGAATGIGGVIRDCLGTGQGARPILNTDVFCFAPISSKPVDVPEGVLHPRQVMRGVVRGVRDYGNRMGIPTANGAVYFDERFMGNPLVFCGTLGIIPRKRLKKSVRKGQAIVLLGGRTGRDGIHGVTFASLELDGASQEFSGGAVQIGNPIEEKKVLDLMLEARDLNLIDATTDCGGGGLSSSVGELAGKSGCEIHLDRVPLKYEGLTPAEVWISEAQERMVVFCAQSKVGKLLELASGHDVEATVIGRTTGTRRLALYWRGYEVADIDMKFLHNGWSVGRKQARWRRPDVPDPMIRVRRDLTPVMLQLLQAPNIASKEWVVRQYDHEVQGLSVMKPFCGSDSTGPTDACVISPRPGSHRAVVVACGLRPRYGLVDPYWMAASAIDEALRNCVAAGGDIEMMALLDNFCWGSPDRPDQLAGLVRAAQACYDIGLGYRTPFISGKDSLYNEFRTATGDSLPIPPTLLISAVSVIADGRRSVTPDFKSPGSAIYLLGETHEELGGSEYYRICQGLGRDVPKVDPARGRRLMRALGGAIARGLVRSCHDLSEGGLGVALAEMAFPGPVGCEVRLRSAPGAKRFRRDDFLLFSESNTRFLCEVAPNRRAEFERLLRGLPCAAIGRTTAEARLVVYGLKGERVVELDLRQAEAVWRRALTRQL